MRYFNSRIAAAVTKRGRAVSKAVTQTMRRWVLGLAASAAIFASAQTSDAAGVVNTPSSFFPIGVWSQPIYTFDKWQSRGINTLFKYEPYGGLDTIDEWSAAANAKGLYMIREPRSNPALDANESRLLAWMHADEPDIHDTPPSVLANNFAKWRAADATKPILVNYSGGELLNGTTSIATYKEYSKYTNWVSSDLYPVTGYNRPDWIDHSKTVADRKNSGTALRKFAEVTGQPQWAFIETSSQKLPWLPSTSRGVTPAEFRGEVWDAIINGAKGIAYFPNQIGSGFRFDTTPADVVAEMTTQNARIQSLAKVLNSSANPINDKITMNSALLEGAKKTYDGDQYFFILNMSSKTLSSQEVVLPGLTGLTKLGVFGEGREISFASGKLFDQFDPWEMHVYHADLAGYGILAGSPDEGSSSGGFDGAAIPEPTSVAVLSIAAVGLCIRRRRR